jgi:hypothetical protein
MKRGHWGLTPTDRVRIEMPLAFDRQSRLVIWHDEPWALTRTPGTRELNRRGYWAPYRFDLAVTRPGEIVLGVEIVNAFEVAPEKAAVLALLPFQTIELSTAWVASASKAPEDWGAGILRTFGGEIA